MAEEVAVEETAPAPKKRHKLHFPTAITVLFIVMLFAAALTYIVPAGEYSKLTYDASQDKFVVTKPDESTELMAPTQKTLDKLGVSGKLENFKNGSISKPIAIPGTYERVTQAPQGGSSSSCSRRSRACTTRSTSSCSCSFWAAASACSTTWAP